MTNKTRHGKTRYKTWILKYNITNKTNKSERIECYINVFFIRMYLQLSTDGDSTLTFVKMHIANNMPLKLNGGILAKAATPHTHIHTHPTHPTFTKNVEYHNHGNLSTNSLNSKKIQWILFVRHFCWAFTAVWGVNGMRNLNIMFDFRKAVD